GAAGARPPRARESPVAAARGGPVAGTRAPRGGGRDRALTARTRRARADGGRSRPTKRGLVPQTGHETAWPRTRDVGERAPWTRIPAHRVGEPNQRERLRICAS